MPGKPGVEMPCGWCGEKQTAASMRKHFTECPKKPKRLIIAGKRLREWHKQP